MDKQNKKTSWQTRLKTLGHRSAANLEELTDIAWSRITRRLKLNDKVHIAAYAGYGNAHEVWVSGRVLANEPVGGPQQDDDWFDNLQATYQRWESDEITGAPVTVTFQSAQKVLNTDGEGYFHATFERPDLASNADVVFSEYRQADPQASAFGAHRVYGPSPNSKRLIISDMDDTVIHTGITNLLLSAQLTFLNNARTRKPLVGVASLYQALVEGPGADEANPIFYVSNSPWNMYDLLQDFVELNDVPAGPLLLRDVGLTQPGAGSRDHKINTIRQIIERLPELPVVLIGDSGQHDAQIYHAILTEYPERIDAIYIRDVDPTVESDRDISVDEVIRSVGDGRTNFLRVSDSHVIAEHLHGLGRISASQLVAVREEIVRDRQRDKLSL